MGLVLPIFSYVFKSARKGMSNSMSLPKIAAPGEALSTVQYVERTVHAASVRKSNMSLGTTVSAMSNSAVWSMVMITVCICSNIAFTWGFLMLVAYA